jgi:voltage-gated potassium channel
MKMINADKEESVRRVINLKHVFLTALLLGLLLLRPLLPSAVMDAIFVPAMILSAWLAGGRTRRSIIVTVISGVAAFALLVFDLTAHEQFRAMVRQPLGFLVTAAAIGLLLYCGGVIMHSLLTAKRVFVDEIIGTFNIYLIMGYVWSYVYIFVELIQPGSFQPATPEDTLGLRFIYFSFITLTTVGFGDTVPASPLAQMLVIFEAIAGQFYVAVVVAYLVSMYITHNLATKKTDD